MVRPPFSAIFALYASSTVTVTVRAQASNVIQCGYSEITLEINQLPDILQDYTVWKIGDCPFNGGIYFNFTNQDNMQTWSYSCGFRRTENETHISFENKIWWDETTANVPQIIFANQFDTYYKTSQFACHFEKKLSTSTCVTETRCEECQDCYWDPDDNCTYTCDIKDMCYCDSDIIILEPIPGEGNFEVRSGLYFDEHLVRKVGPDDEIGDDDETFIGIELIDIQKPTMVVVVEKLWVTATEEQNPPSGSVVLMRKLASGCAIMHPIMGEYPQPNPFDEENPEEHPHLAFQIDYKAISEAFADMPDFSGFFIHLVTKVCVTNGENCFGTCTDAELEEAENERNGRINMLNDGSCVMANDEPEEPGLEVTTPKSTLPVCAPDFGKKFEGYTQSKSSVRIAEQKGSLLDKLKGQLWTEILRINHDEKEVEESVTPASGNGRGKDRKVIRPGRNITTTTTTTTTSFPSRYHHPGHKYGVSVSKQIKNSTGFTPEARPKYFELLMKIQEEEQRIKNARERRNADRLPFEQITPPVNYFEKNGGNRRLSLKGGVVETFGPWPFTFPKIELKTEKQADILFYNKEASNFASWSNSTSGHFVLILILLVDVALGFNALRLRRKQHAKLLE